MENLYKKRGLVLGGGGAKGCYEIGACQAFKECGMHFDVVTGTSIGAIIGSMVVQNNIEPLVDFAYNLAPEKVMDGFFELPDNLFSFVSEASKIRAFINKAVESKGTDITPLRTAYKEMFDYKAFMKSNIQYGCMTYNVKRFEGVPWTKDDMNEEIAEEVILASAACFPAMPMIKINGEEYIDGGYYDNVPIQLAIDLGATDILAINLKAPGVFNDRIYYGANVHVIEPILQLGSFLDFDNQKGMRSLRTGYLEMMKHFGKFAGFYYTFPNEEEKVIREFEEFAQTQNFSYLNYKNLTDEMYKSSFGYAPPAFTYKYREKYYYWSFLECLAFKQGIDPVNLYSFKDFAIKVLDKGPLNLESSSVLKNLREDKEMINNTYKFIYQTLVRFIINAKEDN